MPIGGKKQIAILIYVGKLFAVLRIDNGTQVSKGAVSAIIVYGNIVDIKTAYTAQFVRSKIQSFAIRAQYGMFIVIIVLVKGKLNRLPPFIVNLMGDIQLYLVVLFLIENSLPIFHIAPRNIEGIAILGKTERTFVPRGINSLCHGYRLPKQFQLVPNWEFINIQKSPMRPAVLVVTGIAPIGRKIYGIIELYRSKIRRFRVKGHFHDLKIRFFESKGLNLFPGFFLVRWFY